MNITIEKKDILPTSTNTEPREYTLKLFAIGRLHEIEYLANEIDEKLFKNEQEKNK